MAKILKLKMKINDQQAESLKATFLTEDSYDLLVEEDTDAYSMEGELLFRFRKGAIPLETLRLGYESFKDAIQPSHMRGTAAGSSAKRIRPDGSVSNTTEIVKDKERYPEGNGYPLSGVAGYMDQSALIRYCRKTAFTEKFFEVFKQGIPFVQKVDELYRELCPTYWEKQMKISRGTNRNYRIADTAFTTVTVNKNFQTAVHKDSGDFRDGFGNLCVYREGHYEGSYFCLPQYRVAIDMQNTDILFVDVHRWHGNTPFLNMSEDYLRVSFVMYYREYMITCKQPSDELRDTKMEQGGFLKL